VYSDSHVEIKVALQMACQIREMRINLVTYRQKRCKRG